MQHLLRITISTILLLGMASCGGDDGSGSCDENGLTQDIADEFDAFDAASDVYVSNPTEANCQSWKEAGIAYINAADNYVQNCDGLTPADYNIAVQGALNALAALPCN